MTVSKRAMEMAEKLFEKARHPITAEARWPGLFPIAECIQTVLDEKHAAMLPNPAFHKYLPPDELRHPETFERTVWVNVYPDGAVSAGQKSKHDADSCAHPSRIACIPVTIKGTVGEGLEK